MRIIHVVRNIEYIGGTEKFLISLLGKWYEKFSEDEIFLICIEGVGPVAKDLSKKYKFKVINFPIKWYNPVCIFRFSFKLKSLYPDIVHTHLFQADFPGIIASKLAGLKVVSTKYCQFSMAIEKNTKIERHLVKPISDYILESLLSFLTDKVIVVSKESVNYFLKRNYKISKMFVIPCCHIDIKDSLFDIPMRKLWKNHKIRIGTISRLVPEKGIDNLLYIFSKLYFKYRNIELFIAGDGFLKESLEKQAVSLGITEGVHFLGYVKDINNFLRNIDIFLFTSHSEGFPLAIQEAMAAGKLVVSTRVGGIKELIEDGQSGILYEDGDNHKAVSLLEYLINKPILAQKLASNARKKILSIYNLDQVAESIRNIYISLN